MSYKMSEGKLIIFSAPSGSGKSTIARYLLESIPELEFSISATSRPRRKTEKHGRDYYFLTPEEFIRKIDEDAFIEWEEVYPGRYYGTLMSELERIWSRGHHALFDIDVKGGINLKNKFPGRSLSVFVQPPDMETLEQRLRARATDKEEDLKVRLNKAAQEMHFAHSFDKILINDQLDDALKEAKNMVINFLKQRRT